MPINISCNFLFFCKQGRLVFHLPIIPLHRTQSQLNLPCNLFRAEKKLRRRRKFSFVRKKEIETKKAEHFCKRNLVKFNLTIFCTKTHFFSSPLKPDFFGLWLKVKVDSTVSRFRLHTGRPLFKKG